MHVVSSVTSPSSSGTDSMPSSIPSTEIPEILVTGFIEREDCNLREEGTGEAYFFYFSGNFFFLQIYTNMYKT